MTSTVGAISLAFLSIYNEILRIHMPEILLWAGVSRYHIDQYFTDAGFIRVYRLSLLLSCLLIFSGGMLWLLRVRIFSLISSFTSRLNRLLAIRKCERTESQWTKFDQFSGSVLLGVAVVLMLTGMFTMPIRADEATMYGQCGLFVFTTMGSRLHRT